MKLVSRYDEARKFWDETINTTRNLAHNTCMWMKDKVQQDRMLKLIRAFPVTYNFHVNRKGGHHTLFESDKNLEKVAGTLLMDLTNANDEIITYTVGQEYDEHDRDDDN